MLNFKTWLVETINNDATLQGYLKDSNGNMSVYPTDIDIQPENFPCITYNDAGVAVLSNPQGAHVGILQLNIWSTNNALETEQIHNRLQAVLNFQSSLTASVSIDGILWWMRENGDRDMHTPSRRIFHKVCDIKFWAHKSDLS